MGNIGKRFYSAQVSSEITALSQKKGLIFQSGFDSKKLAATLFKFFPKFRNRVFDPMTTLFAFLSQVLSPDGSCKEAVARVNFERIARGQKPTSPDTGAYCKARDRLPEKWLHELTQDCGKSMEEAVPEQWLWKSRHVKGIDGSTLLMADTPENQECYPQQTTQKKGVGFPICRLVAVFSLATGCLLDLTLGRYAGKQTGEHALLRQLFHCFDSGDLVVGDAYYSAFFLLAVFFGLKVDAVFRSDGKRKIDFRKGIQLGKKDHLVNWSKPQRPDWMDEEDYQAMPKELVIRECEVTINRPGFRTQTIILVTTLLDPKYAPKEELGWLYWRRWHAEINLKALKTTLKLEFIPCKSPEMVRKHIWASALAYNLIRKLIAESAYRYDVMPEELSFKSAVQTLNQYRPLWVNCDSEKANRVLNLLLEALSKSRIGNRPYRIEPRVVKRRPKPFPRLTVPRARARASLFK